ncbi:hypothetical protein HKCCE3408_08870 [Rhodobacterales bacterium HKCCE3408]|nr:hypothetical protein [Rhodobacterales bacterium HKCCE3408]
MKTDVLTTIVAVRVERLRRWFLQGLDGYGAASKPKHPDVPDYLRTDVGLLPRVREPKTADPPRIGPIL